MKLITNRRDELDSDRAAALLEIEELPRPVALSGTRTGLEGEAEAVLGITRGDLPYPDDPAIDQSLDLSDPTSGIGGVHQCHEAVFLPYPLGERREK
jgi:hypothetical protein